MSRSRGSWLSGRDGPSLGCCSYTRPPVPPRPQTPSHAPKSQAAPPAASAHGAIVEDDGDVQLVEDIRRGRAGAWSTLITRYQDRLFTVCLRMVHNRELAADLTQDSFVKVIQGLDKYDGRSKLSTWMIRVTMNVCLSKMRSEKLRRHASLEGMSSGGGGGDAGRAESEHRAFELADDRTAGGVVGRVGEGELSEEPGVIHDEDRRRVLRALQLLEPDQRAVLMLRDAQGLEYDQIAEVLGVAVGTIKSRLFRARSALRDEMGRLGGED